MKVVSAGVDAATTSQSEADEKRGRELRKQDEERGKQARGMAQERCRKGRPLPTDDCAAAAAALRYFLDTEYNGWGGALLSLALVPDDGEELYLTLDWRRRRSSRGSSATSCPISTRCPSSLVSPRLSRADAARDDRALSRRRSASR